MPIDFESLLAEAFFVADAKEATRAIESARNRVAQMGHVTGFSVEVVAPARPDAAWLGEKLIGPLIYFCQSSGVPPPPCTGVFVSLFHGTKVYFILGAELIAWGASVLGIPTDELIARYGTHEGEHAPGSW